MDYQNILIIKMSSLGDILHALPFAAALRKRFPTARISWLVHPQFAGFLPDAPVIDEVLYFDKVKFQKMNWRAKYRYFCELRQLLSSKRFDLVIDLQGLLKSAVLAAISGCEKRIGYCEMREGSGFVSKAISGAHARDHVIERYLDVARSLGAEINSQEEVEFPLPDLTVETGSVRQKLAALGLPEKTPFVVFVPGARWATKCWPVEHYAELAQKIIADGTYIVLAGGADDVAKGAAIVKLAASDQIIDLTGKTSLRELAALIKESTFYISADTGPLHLAAALKKPLIAMYGPTEADRTGPYGNAAATVLLSPAKCVGCLKKRCSDWHCMYDITAAQVYKLYQEKIVISGANTCRK